MGSSGDSKSCSGSSSSSLVVSCVRSGTIIRMRFDIMSDFTRPDSFMSEMF